MNGMELDVAAWVILVAGCLALAGRNRWLHERCRDLEDFSRKLLESQEKERRRIATELHGSLGQNLLIIKNRALLGLGSGSSPSQTAEQLQVIGSTCSEALEQTRRIAHDLGTRHLEQLGLTQALDAMIDRVADSTTIRFERKLESVDDVFDLEAATNLYRIAQEGLNNVLKHAHASCVRVELLRDLQDVQFVLQDNGRGFDPGANSFRHNGGLGLAEISQRARILKGKLQLESDSQRGTRLTVRIPFAEDPLLEGEQP